MESVYLKNNVVSSFIIRIFHRVNLIAGFNIVPVTAKTDSDIAMYFNPCSKKSKLTIVRLVAENCKQITVLNISASIVPINLAKMSVALLFLKGILIS